MLGGANARTQKRYRAVRDKHVRHCAARRVAHWGQVDERAVKEYGTWLTAQEYGDATVYLECTLLKQVIK